MIEDFKKHVLQLVEKNGTTECKNVSFLILADEIGKESKLFYKDRK